MDGLLRVYSEYSLKECALGVPQICRHAAALGYGAVMLSDKDSLSGIAELVRECRRNGLKPVPGVELSGEGIVLAAKDYTGYQGLCRKLCGEESLEELFGEGTKYHGHVAAFSGGMEGTLARTACRNRSQDRRRCSMEKELAQIKADKKTLEKAEKDLSRQTDKLKTLEHEKVLTGTRAGKNFVKKEEAVYRETDMEKRKKLQEALDAEKQDCAEAEKELKRLSARITNAKKRLGILNSRVKELKSLIERKAELEALLGEPSLNLDDNELIDQISQKAEYYRSLFGEFYIELFFHGLEDEAYAMPLLMAAAERSGTKTVLSNGVLVCEPDEDELYRLHAARFLKDNIWTKPDNTEKEYFMKTERELIASVDGIIPADASDLSIVNMHRFFDKCSFEWEKAVPVNYSALLSDRAQNGGVWGQVHESRLEAELKAAKEAGIEQALLSASETGWSGTGNGSVLCRLLGLTGDVPDVNGGIEQAVDTMRQCIRGAFTEKCMGTPPSAAVVPDKNRIHAKAAIRLAGRAAAQVLYGSPDALKTLTAEMADAVPATETVREFMPALYEAFADTDAEAVASLAVHFEGLLAGLEPGNLYTAAENGVLGKIPFFRKEDICCSGFDADGVKDAGLPVFSLADTDEAGLVNEAVRNIYRIRGIRVDIAYEKPVFRNVLKVRQTCGIPGCSTQVQETLSAMGADEFASLIDSRCQTKAGCTENWGGIYQCAWLKYYYPLEYMLAVLNSLRNPEALPLLVEECRRLGIAVYGPDINCSIEKFSEEKGGIRFGLSSVKGVRQNAAMIVKNRDGCYAGFVDFIVRSGADKVATKSLIQAGAFDQFSRSRSALLFVYDRMSKHASRVNLLNRRILEKEETLRTLTTKASIKQMGQSIEKDKNEVSFLMEALGNVPVPDMEDTAHGKLVMEKETLSVPISPHPIDPYLDYLQNTTAVAAAGEGTGIWLAGYVTGYETIHTKKNKEMAVFELEDKTGKIKVLVWPRTYERYRKFLKNDAVLKLYGDCRPAWKNPKKMEFHPSIIRSPVPKIKQTFILADTMGEWQDSILPKLQPYIDRHGSRVIVYDMETGRVTATDIFIKDTEIQGIRSAKARTFLDLEGFDG